MKKILNVLLFLNLFLCINVKADMGGPMVVGYEAIVTNKNGAVCYDLSNGKYIKLNKTLPYGKLLNIYTEADGNYIMPGELDCWYVKTSDISAKKESFSVNESSVEKITPVNGIILAKGGLNLRKGPAVVYGRITTIPQYSIIKVTHRAGTYWYFVEYNGKTGWVSGINQYLGIDNDNILYSYKDIDITDNKGRKLGKIPAYTEVTDFIELNDYDGYQFLVNYNGILGYVSRMTYKVNGQVKILKDVNIYNNRKVVKTVKAGTTLDYTIQNWDELFIGKDQYGEILYIPKENGLIGVTNIDGIYEYVGEPKTIKKTKGFLGEGLFGEEKKTVTKPVEENKEKPVIQDNKKESEPWSMSKEIIIICVLGSIVLALTIVIIILLVNNKKKNKDVKEIIKDKSEESENSENK